MLRRFIRHELPDPIMKPLGELELLIKGLTEQRCETVTDNVKIGIVLSGIKSKSIATHLALNGSRFTNFGHLSLLTFEKMTTERSLMLRPTSSQYSIE